MIHHHLDNGQSWAVAPESNGRGVIVQISDETGNEVRVTLPMSDARCMHEGLGVAIEQVPVQRAETIRVLQESLEQSEAKDNQHEVAVFQHLIAELEALDKPAPSSLEDYKRFRSDMTSLGYAAES